MPVIISVPITGTIETPCKFPKHFRTIILNLGCSQDYRKSFNLNIDTWAASAEPLMC